VEKAEDIKNNLVSDEEIQYMLKLRPLVHSENELITNYGEAEAKLILEGFSKLGKENAEKYLPTLAHFGVGSRWRQFLQWLETTINNKSEPKDATDAFRQFGNYLGRVISYRALALTEDQFQTIKDKDTIWPSGRLKTDYQTLDAFVKQKGVRFIAYARLYIGLGLLPFDPSLSLHDDPETAVCIAGGYIQLPSKKLYLMTMDIPKIEVLGFTVSDVQDRKSEGNWFEHRSVWFDARLERTERYCLYEIPFFNKRCKSIKIFDSKNGIKDFIYPFAKSQQEKKK